MTVSKVVIKVEYLLKVERMNERCIADCRLGETGFEYTMSLIQGKYRMFILYTLMEFGTVRFNEMKRYIDGISYKSLSDTLKALEAEGLIVRKDYGEIPPRVEYSLSERGTSLMPILDQMCQWGDDHRHDVL